MRTTLDIDDEVLTAAQEIGKRGKRARVKYFDLSGGSLTSLGRRQQNRARGSRLAGTCR